MEKLTEGEVQAALGELDGWEINVEGMIEKTFEHKSFDLFGTFFISNEMLTKLISSAPSLYIQYTRRNRQSSSSISGCCR